MRKIRVSPDFFMSLCSCIVSIPRLVFEVFKSEPVYRLAILTVAIIAAYFGFSSLVNRDCLVVTSPSPDEVVVGQLQISGVWLRRAQGLTVRLEHNDKTVRTWTHLPISEDISGLPTDFYHLVFEIRNRILFFSVLSQIVSIPIEIDNTPPTIVVTGLSDGDYVSEQVEVGIKVVGGQLTAIQIDHDEDLLFRVSETGTIRLNTVDLSDGNHELRLSAADGPSQIVDLVIPFVVENWAPEFSLGPIEDLSVLGDITISPAIRRGSFKWLAYMLDGNYGGVIQSPSFILPSSELTNGWHHLQVTVCNMVEKRKSREILFLVDKGMPYISLNPSPEERVTRHFYLNDTALGDAETYVSLFDKKVGTDVSFTVTDAYSLTDTDSIDYEASMRMDVKIEPSFAGFLYQNLGPLVAELYTGLRIAFRFLLPEQSQMRRIRLARSTPLFPAYTSPPFSYTPSTPLFYVGVVGKTIPWLELGICVQDALYGFYERFTLGIPSFALESGAVGGTILNEFVMSGKDAISGIEHWKGLGFVWIKAITYLGTCFPLNTAGISDTFARLDVEFAPIIARWVEREEKTRTLKPGMEGKYLITEPEISQRMGWSIFFSTSLSISFEII